VQLVSDSGVDLKRHGADLVGRCPFHEDKTPSLVVTPSKNLWHCLGACNKGGSVIDWVIATKGVSFRHAVELLKSGVTLDSDIVKVGTIRRLPSPIAIGSEESEMLKQVLSFYHDTLLDSPVCKAYLDKRKIGDRAVTQKFQLGYSNRTLGLRVPEKNRVAGKEIRESL
jgi:DNA primase